MKHWLNQRIKPYMIRPIMYKTCSYILMGMAIAFLWRRFINNTVRLPMGYAYTVGGFFFLAAAWISYLRLDGINVPILKFLPIGGSRRATGSFDMSDFVDQQVVNFEELVDEEKHACCLMANVICGLVFLALALV